MQPGCSGGRGGMQLSLHPGSPPSVDAEGEGGSTGRGLHPCVPPTARWAIMAGLRVAEQSSECKKTDRKACRPTAH